MDGLRACAGMSSHWIAAPKADNRSIPDLRADHSHTNPKTGVLIDPRTTAHNIIRGRFARYALTVNVQFTAQLRDVCC